MTLQAGENRVLTTDQLTLRVHYAVPAAFKAELDTSIFLLNAVGKVGGDSDFIFFNQPATANRSVVMQSVPQGSVIMLDLSKVAVSISKIAITLVIDGDAAFAALNSVTLNVENVA